MNNKRNTIIRTGNNSKINDSKNNILHKLIDALKDTAFIADKLKQVICLAMIFSMLSVSIPAAPQIITQSVLRFRQNTVLLFLATDYSYRNIQTCTSFRPLLFQNPSLKD